MKFLACPKFLSSLLLVFIVSSQPFVANGEQASDSSEKLTITGNDAAGFFDALSRLKKLREQGDKKPITLEIPAGVYRFEQTIELTPELVGEGLQLKSIAKANEQVVFSGGQLLGTGKRDAQGNWRYQLPAGWKERVAPRALIINQKLQSAARYPNHGYLRIEKSLADRRSGFIVSDGDLPSNFDLDAAPCDLIFLHDWSSSRLPVASYQKESRELRTVGPIGCAGRHFAIDHFEKQPRYWLEGQPSFADLPGEWFIDYKTEQIVVVASKADQQPPRLVLPRLMEILVASGTEKAPLQNLTIAGITFTGTRFPMPAGGVAGVQATMHEPRDAQGNRLTKNYPMLLAAVKIERAEGCQLLRCTFQALGGTAVWLAGQTKSCSIKYCKIRDVGGNGINLGEDSSRHVNGKIWYQSVPQQISTGNTVERCEISFCGQMLPGSVGIWAALNKQLKILSNNIHDTPYTGISLGWIWSQTPSPAGENIIRGNKIEFVMQTLSDGGGIYTLGRQPGSIIENNTISDVPLNAGRAESNGMFLDEGTTGFTIRNNTIRRIDRSPLRFHRAGKNNVIANRWDLANEKTPPVRYNSTPEKNISLKENVVLPAQKQIYFIGNSLTWDTIPPLLDGHVLWHVDCGKSQKYIFEHPESPCVDSSRIWPLAMRTTQFDTICFQPHYGMNIDEDYEVISKWISIQENAAVLIHTGWAPYKSLVEEWNDTDPAGKPTHSTAYYNELLKRLREKFPNRSIRSTNAMNYLHQIQQDIQAGKAPFAKIEEIYRDAIHMKLNTGRYLMHNVIRKALGQPHKADGFPATDPKTKTYLNNLLKKKFD